MSGGSPAPPVGVLIVDDQKPFRQAASRMVALMDGFEVVAEADSGERAVEIANELAPELVIMDVRLSGMNGAEATRKILDRCPSALVVLVSTHHRVDLTPDIDRCGAVGFWPKEQLDESVLRDVCESGHRLAIEPERPDGGVSPLR